MFYAGIQRYMRYAECLPKTYNEGDRTFCDAINNPQLSNLLLDPYFKENIFSTQEALRDIIVAAVQNEISIPSHTSALHYYDGYRSKQLPANLLQAQRDYFGAHTYERLDKTPGQFFHTDWTGEGGDTTSTSYTT